ncbi:unnamed protein product, partial [Discosporangium mesarthrocarpum]
VEGREKGHGQKSARAHDPASLVAAAEALSRLVLFDSPRAGAGVGAGASQSPGGGEEPPCVGRVILHEVLRRLHSRWANQVETACLVLEACESRTSGPEGSALVEGEGEMGEGRRRRGGR